MSIIRNKINITGITPEEELPSEIKGQIIEFAESDYIYIPESVPTIHSLYKIDVKVIYKEGRVIDSHTGKIIVMDGIRKVNLTYVPVGYYQNYFSLNLEMPFNTFIDIPNNVEELEGININIVDAYFRLINTRKIYNHMLYMIDVRYPNKNIKSTMVDKTINITTFTTED